MDIATLAGTVFGLALLLWAIARGGPLGDFIHLPSLAITIGGILAATLINYPLQQVLGVFRVARHAFVRRPSDPARLIDRLVAWAEHARREGLLALEDEAEAEADEFLRRGLLLVVDGTDAAQVRHILETELDFLEERHSRGAHVFATMAQLAPAFGLIGTLIGLVQMLRLTNEPARIGPGMAMALLTTLYGVFLANFVFLPIAGKLKARSAEEVVEKELIIEGLLALQGGESPKVIGARLQAFLAPDQRREPAGAGVAAGQPSPAARRAPVREGRTDAG